MIAPVIRGPRDLVVAVDVGGTFTKLALFDRDGVVRAEESVPTFVSAREIGDDGTGSVEWLAATIRGFTDHNMVGALRSFQLAGFGVVIPGVVAGGVAISAENIGWRNTPLEQELSRRLRLDGVVDHDVRAAGRAEWQLGAGAGRANVMFVPLGTGIAAAVVVDGRMLVADGYAGELGHIAVPSAGEQLCACGGLGCLEVVASAAGVSRTFARLTGRSLTVPAEQVASLARSGAPAAVRTFNLAGTALAEALLTALTLFGPELIVIGGGLSGAADLFLPVVEEQLTAKIRFQRRPELITASFGSRAGMIGAQLVAWDRVDHGAADTSEARG